MNLDDKIYLIIRDDGEYCYILRNDMYSNHYLYLNDLRNSDDYLKDNSFGLEFKQNDQVPKIMFFKTLTDDGCVIFENLKVTENENISCFDIYLPKSITKEQLDLLNTILDTNEIKTIFLEKYEEELSDFIPLYKTKEDLENGKELFKKYINQHTRVKEK